MTKKKPKPKQKENKKLKKAVLKEAEKTGNSGLLKAAIKTRKLVFL